MALRHALWLWLAMPALALAQTASNPVFFNPANGHYYEAVVYLNEADFPSWTQARDLAASRTFRGVAGYLATVTSKSENDFLITYIGPLRSPRGDLWIGGTDDPVDGEWRWVTGPEAGTLFWLGGPDGKSVLFADWAPGSPNNAFGPGSESRLGWVEDGWNDLPDSAVRPGFIVEYSGVPADGQPTAGSGPDIIELRTDPVQLYAGQEGYGIVVADASSEGRGATIAGIQLSINGGAWRALGALDGRYDGTWETALTPIGPFGLPGNYSLCAKATDSAGATSAPVCTRFPVIDIHGFGDFQPPVVSELHLYRPQAYADQDNQVTAFASDSDTGGSTIQDFQYSVHSLLPGQTPGIWQAMRAIDGAFDNTFESATAIIPAIGLPGSYEVCVRAVDSAGNFSQISCTPLELHAR